MWGKTIVMLSAGLMLSANSWSQDNAAAVRAIDDALPGKLIHNPLEIKWESDGDDKKIKLVKADTPSGQALSARVKKRKQKPWDIVVSFDLDDGVKVGDQVEMHFWARTAKAAKGHDTAKFVVFVGENVEPYDNIISEEYAPGEAWKIHTMRNVAKKDIPAGEMKVEYQIGKYAQTIEFGPVYVSNLGPAAE